MFDRFESHHVARAFREPPSAGIIQGCRPRLGLRTEACRMGSALARKAQSEAVILSDALSGDNF